MAEKKPPIKRKQCGTTAGYNQHIRHREQACDDCRAAKREDTRARRAGEKPKKGISKAQRQRDMEKKGAEIAEAVHEAVNGVSAKSGESYPNFLKTAGRDLWDEVTAEYSLNPASRVVLAEACRMTDRLDRFAAALSSKKTFWFELGDAENALEDGVPVVVNNMIGEARQMTAGIRQALNSIGVLQAGEKKSKGNSITDELQRKRQQRLAVVKSQGV